MSEQCGNCRFWRIRTDKIGERGGGYCVRFPPFAPSSWTQLPGMGAEMSALYPSSCMNDAWPMVHQQSWCGEYSAGALEDSDKIIGELVGALQRIETDFLPNSREEESIALDEIRECARAALSKAQSHKPNEGQRDEP